MDYIEKSGVNIAHCVYVEGVMNTQADDELVDYLRTYGDIKMAFTVTDSDSLLYKNLIVEFSTDAALNKLKPLLPYTYESEKTEGYVCHVKLLKDEFSATATGGSATITSALPKPRPNYLHELKLMARRSGQPFEEALREVMDQLSGHLAKVEDGSGDLDDDSEEGARPPKKAASSKPVAKSAAKAKSAKEESSDEDDDDDEEDDSEEDDDDDDDDDNETDKGVRRKEDPVGAFGVPTTAGLTVQAAPPPQQSAHSSTGQPAGRPFQRGASINAGQRLSLSGRDLMPPEVQRVVVEHIVRKDDMSMQSVSPLRLRTFSGRTPKPSNEADYDSWRSHIELLRADPSLSQLHVTRRIIESLLPPAAELVKGLGPDSLPTMFIQVLDSAFATVQDGDELFAQFLNTLQDHGERPSSYLQRLQLTLNTVVKRGGIPARDTDKHLLKQFIRGCWDNAVITKLQLEQKRDNPPAFSELLFLLRTEEDRQLAKESLMKKHISSSKHRANLQSQSASTCSCGHSDSSAIEELRKQMHKLQSQMSALLAKKTSSPASDQHQSKSKPSKPKANSSSKPQPWFCFKCGEDGHIAPACTQPANPSLVEQKRRQLKQKQQAWDGKNSKQLN